MTKKINLNTITYFKAKYVDDDGKKAKARRHIVSEIKGDNLLHLKLTSERRGLHARKAVDYTECLDKNSYAIFNRKVSIFLSELEKNKYQYFYICPLHPSNCLENFTEIIQKAKEYWEDELTRDKKVILVNANELEAVEELPQWVHKKKQITKKKS